MKSLKFYITGFALIIILIIFFASGFFSKEKKQTENNYDWKLTYEDQFDNFDRTKYLTRFESGSRTIWSNNELQWYKDENVKSEGGLLKITAGKESLYGKDVHGEKQFEFTSGMILGKRAHMQAYGKWEIKCKFPFRKGYWPAFWLVPDQQPTLPEVDVFEYFGVKKDKVWSNHHWGMDYPSSTNGINTDDPAPFYYSKGKETEGDFADVWHVWSLECFPDKLIWKLDGNEIFQATEGIPTAPLFFIINVAVKDWPDNNYKVDNSDETFVMEVDYVKVYQMVPKP